MSTVDTFPSATAAVGGSGPLQIRCVEDAAGFEALAEEWTALHEQDVESSVFVSWEWLFAWWKHYGRGQPLRLYTAYQGPRLVGILPLYVQQRRALRAIAVRVLRFIGTGGDTSPDYLGPILHPDWAPAAAAALLETVLARTADWDVLCLSDMSEQLPFRAWFEAQCARHNLGLSVTVAAEILYENLPGSWDDYLASLSQHRRRHVRSSRRKLEQQHGATFFVADEGPALEAAFDRLAMLHRARFTAKGVQHSFSSPQYVGFHRDAVHACARRGWIRFFGLEVDGVAIALFYCYQRRGEIFIYQTGMDPQFARMRPGLALVGCMFEHAIAEGGRLIDFMRGDYHFKSQWCRQKRATVTVTAYRRTPAAALFRLQQERIPAGKAWIKRRAPWLAALRGGGTPPAVANESAQDKDESD